MSPQSSMTSDAIRLFIERHLGAWQRQDIDALSANYSDEAEITSPIFQTIRGRRQIESSWRELFASLSDWEFEGTEVIVDRDRDAAVLLSIAHNTQRGELLGAPPTGRRSHSRCAIVYRFADGRIVSESRLYDFAGMLIQLGVLKAKTS